MDIGDMKPSSLFFKMRLLVLLVIGGASVLANISEPIEFRQALRDVPEYMFLNHGKLGLTEKRIDTDKDILKTTIRDYIKALREEKENAKNNVNLNYRERYQDQYFEGIDDSEEESRQQLHEEPSLQLNNRVPRNLDTTDDDDTENEAFKAPYSDRIIKLIDELKEEIDKHLVREKGIDVMTTIFETLIKPESDDEWSSEESTDLDSDDYENMVFFGHNITNEIITGISKLLNKYSSKNLHVNWVLNIIQDTLESSFDVSPTDLACFERNKENLMNEVKVAHPLYLFDSECRGTLSEYMREPNRNKKSTVNVLKNYESLNSFNRFKRSPPKSILGKRFKTKAAALINDLQDDDVFLNEFFEIGLYLNDQAHPSESNEISNEPDENVENNINVDHILHNCEQIASERFLIAIESAVLKFLFYSTCKSIDGTGYPVKRSIKEALFNGFKDQFELNSLSKIKEKIAALNLSLSNKKIYLPIVEQILKAFYVKLPPVMKKVLGEIKPRFKKLNLNALDTDEGDNDMEFIDMTKHRSVRGEDSNQSSNVLDELFDERIIKTILDIILDHIMKPDQDTSPEGLVSTHNTTESKLELNSLWDVINRRIQKNVS